MFSKLSHSIVQLLQQEGIQAGTAYPRQSIDRGGECFVRAAVESVSQSEPGFACFLGIERQEDGSEYELYGMKCDVSLALDIYCSLGTENGAESCESAVDDIILALGQWEGLRISGFSCKRAKPDRDTEMFLCPCRAELTVLLTAKAEEEAAQFSDFILKGEIKK